MATRKQATTRLAKRLASVDALKTVLTSIPKVDPDVVQTATAELMNAADDYMASQPLVDPKGRRSKPNLAEARASVAALQKHLAKALEQLSVLPLDARTAIGQATNAPLGKMRSDIEQVRQVVEKALVELSARPRKIADAARNVLAYQVAAVFRDTLKVKPTSTSDKQLTANMSTARGGAAYARVLRATLKAAGVVNYDPGPLIAAGLTLLKDPNLPSAK
ncbi:hypothetical protein [Rhodoferax antarcticus]|uniref:Uncharacterized protein n=1 Tax=Rhodoferax antarcticus ANT.BR TaxID=1111071 RepID=A0A1Q8YC20_9BURK|nr:hypothetical protein [Rhodoferax antarcticus]APW46667.1 hypothetical protein RA876_10135 [Rhodoferax antarcticus]OLP05557.1 hypothetical protein BLL52_3225 [Rhodoferax antarcticus ANT.BR]